MSIEKSEGTTASERYLAQLCENSFLKLWSYPNLYRDQSAPGGQGKELCDLLVVFGDDVIIFSDKNCEFPDTGDILRDWCRWYKRAIKKSAVQVFGAERWIRAFPQQVFVDRECKTQLPLSLPDSSVCRIHRVVVALGAKKRCIQCFDDKGSGSMMLIPGTVGDAHCDPKLDCIPFTVGQIDPNRGFVHVFDDVTLDAILGELDTISDFLSYLNKKEGLISAGQLLAATGEEDLLACYLQNTDNKDGQHRFPLSDDSEILTIGEGWWDDLNQNPAYIAKKAADKVSYLWDKLIQEFSEHALAGTLVNQSERSFQNIEIPLQTMARESRLRRRVLGGAFLNAMRTAVQNCSGRDVYVRTVLESDFKGTAYVFVMAPHKGGPYEDRPYAEYRKYRSEYALGYCMALAWKYRDMKRVVGIGTDAGFQKEGCSHDVVMCDTEVWTPEMETYVQEFQSQTGVLQDRNITKGEYHVTEYPEDISRSNWK